MKRAAQPSLSEEAQQALEYYAHALQHVEDLSPVTLRNYVSDLRQLMAWCECSWHEAQENRSFTAQNVASPFIVRYRSYIQTTLWLKPATVNRALMSLKRYFAWATREQIIQYDPSSLIKF